MSVLWIFMAFWLGGCAALLLFAGVQSSRDAQRKAKLAQAEPPVAVEGQPSGR